MKSAMDTQAYISTKFNEGLEEGESKGKGKAEGLEEGESKGKGKAEGLEEGEAKGKASKSIEIARNMLSNGLDSDTIARCTGLSKSEIEKIKS